MELFAVLTVQKQLDHRGPVSFRTVNAVVTPGPGATRMDMLQLMRDYLPEELRDGIAVFWSCEPLRFGDAPPAPLAPEPESASI